MLGLNDWSLRVLLSESNHAHAMKSQMKQDPTKTKERARIFSKTVPLSFAIIFSQTLWLRLEAVARLRGGLKGWKEVSCLVQSVGYPA